jgi:small subunit ribosomal protein S1
MDLDNGTVPDDEFLDIDEGWWNSVLEKEEAGTSLSENYDLVSPIDEFRSSEIWKGLMEIFHNDEIIPVTVYGFNRGGLLVRNDNVQGFIPISHVIGVPVGRDESVRKKLFEEYVEKTIQVKIIECVLEEKRIVFSERAALAGKGKRNQLYKELKTGDITEGKVTNITSFGVFVDLGGVEGLIHLSELSWCRVQKPEEELRISDVIKVYVLDVNEADSRIALSLKRLLPNPWENLTNRFCPGDVLPGTVTCFTKFGIFVRLQIGVEGLIHVSSLGVSDAREFSAHYSVGDHIEVKILHLDIERRRLGLLLVSSHEQVT